MHVYSTLHTQVAKVVAAHYIAKIVTARYIAKVHVVAAHYIAKVVADKEKKGRKSRPNKLHLYQ